MNVSTSTVVILSLIAASVLWSVLIGGRLPKPYDTRPCQGKGWRIAFPSASKQDIREFLALFVDAFAFSQKERLKLNPEDQVIQIYRAIYPSQWTPDALELETFAKDVEAKYGFTLESIWHEKVTLGELFKIAQRANAQ
jgi:propanediol dehydratase small subunit